MTRKPTKEAVLVVGGAGYVGSHVVDALVDSGRTVVVLDSLVTGIRRTVSAEAVFYEGEAANNSLVRTIMELHRVGGVVHAAAIQSSRGELDRDPVTLYRNNVSGLVSLLESAVSCGVGTFVLCSGSSEESHASPQNKASMDASSRSMRMGEQILRDTAAAHSLRFAILRHVEVAGGDRPDNSLRPTGQRLNLIQEVAQVALGKRKCVKIRNAQNNPDGSAIRDYVHVRDLAAAYVAALEQLEGGTATALELACGYGQGYSDLEILQAAERVTNTRIPHELCNLGEDEPAVLVSDNRTVIRQLGWVPRHAELDEMVMSTYRAELRSLARGAA